MRRRPVARYRYLSGYAVPLMSADFSGDDSLFQFLRPASPHAPAISAAPAADAARRPVPLYAARPT